MWSEALPVNQGLSHSITVPLILDHVLCDAHDTTTILSWLRPQNIVAARSSNTEGLGMVLYIFCVHSTVIKRPYLCTTLITDVLRCLLAVECKVWRQTWKRDVEKGTWTMGTAAAAAVAAQNRTEPDEDSDLWTVPLEVTRYSTVSHSTQDRKWHIVKLFDKIQPLTVKLMSSSHRRHRQD